MSDERVVSAAFRGSKAARWLISSMSMRVAHSLSPSVNTLGINKHHGSRERPDALSPAIVGAVLGSGGRRRCAADRRAHHTQTTNLSKSQLEVLAGNRPLCMGVYRYRASDHTFG